MQQFLDIVIFIDIGLCILQYKAKQMVQRLIQVNHHVLHYTHVHSHHVVQYLDTEDG